MNAPLPIKKWLQGQIGVNIPDETLTAKMWNNGICANALMCEVPEESADLCLADLFWWLSLQPSTKNKVEDSDGQWKHIEGGYIMTEQDKVWYRKQANELRKKWGIKVQEQATVKLVNL